MKTIIAVQNDYALVFNPTNTLTPYVVVWLEKRDVKIGEMLDHWLQGHYFQDITDAAIYFKNTYAPEPKVSDTVAKALVDRMLEEVTDYEFLDLSEQEYAIVLEACTGLTFKDDIELTINRVLNFELNYRFDTGDFKWKERDTITEDFNNGNKLFNKIEAQDWNIEDEGDSYRISKYSDEGEDFSFSIEKSSTENMKKEIIDYAEDFDPEEHAEMWIEIRGTRGVPNSIRALIKDAESIKDGLLNLAEDIGDVQ